jgi:hypothetical protein
MLGRYLWGAALGPFLVAFLAAAHRLSWPCRIRSFASGLRTLFLREGGSTGDTETTFAGRPRFGLSLTSSDRTF